MNSHEPKSNHAIDQLKAIGITLALLFLVVLCFSTCSSTSQQSDGQQLANSGPSIYRQLELAEAEDIQRCKMDVRMITIAATRDEPSNVLKAARGALKKCNIAPSDLEEMLPNLEGCKRMANHGYVGSEPLVKFLEGDINSIEYGATNSTAHLKEASLQADNCDAQISDLRANSFGPQSQ